MESNLSVSDFASIELTKGIGLNTYLTRRRGTRGVGPADEGAKGGRDAQASGVGARGLGVYASEGGGREMERDHGSPLCKCCKPPCPWLPPFLFVSVFTFHRVQGGRSDLVGIRNTNVMGFRENDFVVHKKKLQLLKRFHFDHVKICF